MILNFPRTKFVDGNSLVMQICHIGTEHKEAEEAALLPDTMHAAEEIMDVLHSC